MKAAVLSEKAYKLMERGIYTFLVDPTSNKKQIAKSIEGQFSVHVRKVNVLKLKTKSKRIGKSRKTTQVGGGKKAIVYLLSGQSISMLLPKTESKKTKTSKAKKETKEVKETKAKDRNEKQKKSKKGFLARLKRSKDRE